MFWGLSMSFSESEERRDWYQHDMLGVNVQFGQGFDEVMPAATKALRSTSFQTSSGRFPSAPIVLRGCDYVVAARLCVPANSVVYINCLLIGVLPKRRIALSR